MFSYKISCMKQKRVFPVSIKKYTKKSYKMKSFCEISLKKNILVCQATLILKKMFILIHCSVGKKKYVSFLNTRSYQILTAEL